MVKFKVKNTTGNIIKNVLELLISLTDDDLNLLVKFMSSNEEIIFLSDEDYELSESEYENERKDAYSRGYKFNLLEILQYINYYNEERYFPILNKFNPNREDIVDEKIETTDGIVYNKFLQNYIDNNWELNESLHGYIFGEIDPTYTIEEIIAYIYIKLCILLEYEASYVIDETMDSSYDKNVLENVSTTQNKVLCSDFTKICTKLFNGLDPSIDARCVRCGSSARAHEFVVLTVKGKDIKIEFEPVDVIEHFNDLTRAKLGLNLAGINYVSDENNTFKNAVDKVYRDIQKDNVITTENLVEEYEQINKSLPIINFDDSMMCFIENMKTKNIKGNELIIMFMKLERIGYFGNITYSFISFNQQDNYKERAILIEHNGTTYYFRTEARDIFAISKHDLNRYFEDDIITYEDEKYIIDGVGKGVVVK